MKYLKKFTVKEWDKFDKIVDQEDGEPLTGQEILLRKYKIILTDHQTRAEKLHKLKVKLIKMGTESLL